MSRPASRRLRTSAGVGRALIALALLSLVAPAAFGQCVSLTTLGTAYTQNFDTLASTGTSSTLPTGWAFVETGTNANTVYTAGTGSSNAGDTYSFGAAASTERALGGLLSGSLVPLFGACFTNNTGSTIASLDIAYTGEEWRLGTAGRTDRINFVISTDATSLTTGTYNGVTALNFVTPVTTTIGAKDGNAAANRTALMSTVSMLSIGSGASFWIAWTDFNATGADDGLAVDDFSLTPQGGVVTPSLTINDVSLNEGNAGTTTFTFTVSLSAPAPAGGVTFDIATADGTAQDDNPIAEDNDYVAKSLSGQTIPSGSSTYAFDVLVNGDAGVEPNETFFVNVTNVTGATVGDGQGQGTIVNDDIAMVRIHDVQGNGAATPILGSTVTVEGVVVADFQASAQLQGFFLEEEDADWDADPATSEGIFVFCITCPTAVAEGQRVQVTGSVSEFFNKTEITASTAGSVVITNAGNNLAEVTPVPIDLPVVGVVDTFYEALEGMRVTFVDSLTVSEYFELSRYGQVVLYEGGRPRQFTEASAPSVAGLVAYNDTLSRRVVLLDDDDNTQNAYLSQTDSFQSVFHPQANGGLSVGAHGVDFFRGGDLVNNLTGVLDWSFAGLSGTDAWRIRPTQATPATFTVANPRPMTAPPVGGAIKAAGMNLLNYFTTIDATSSSSSGPCAPGMTQDCRGADSVAELNRQRERASIVVCGLDADVVGFVELENTTASDTISDLLGAVNTLCGGANPYDFVNTGGTLGTDAIRVQLIYRTGILSPVGGPISDLDPVHNRPPTAQTFDVVDATNPAFGERFTVVINHFKSKGCPGTGADADMNDGQSCFNGTRVAQANRLLTWLTGTVLPAAGDPDLLLLGDFNANAMEDPVTTITGGGFTDLETAFLGANAYSYVFDGAIGHLDYAFSSASLTPQVTGVEAWHINADEIPLFDYSDEVKDTGEAAFEEKPDGSALVPPRVVFQAMSPFRASDHDPILVGLFPVADLSMTKTDAPDPVTAGTNLTYTITVDNAGPDPASTVAWSDTLPAGTTFVSLSSPGGWSCMTPAVGAGGSVSCSIGTLAVGSAPFTLVVAVDPAVASGTVLSNTAAVTSTTADPDTGDLSATAMTTVATSANLGIVKDDSPDPVAAGGNLTYTISVSNAGPSAAAMAQWSDTLPAGTTFVSLTSLGGWSCSTPAVGAGGTVTCSIASLGVGGPFDFTLVVNVGVSLAGMTVTNTADVASATSDPTSSDDSFAIDTVVGDAADLAITKVDTPDPVTAGNNLTYTVTVTNNGATTAVDATWSDTLPAGTTFVSLTSPAGWSCTTPAVGSGGTVTCDNASFAVGSDMFTLIVAVATTATGTLSNTAAVSATTPDPVSANDSATAMTTVATSADLALTKVDTADPVTAGTDLTYTVTVTNNGPSAAADAQWSDTLPGGTTFVSLTSPAGWSCMTPAVDATGAVTCTNLSFDLGSSVFTLVVHVASAATGTLSNTATASASTPDPTPGNDSDTETTTLSTSADLAVGLADSPDPVPPGSALGYAITVTNNGPSDAASVTFSMAVPAGTTFASMTAAGWSCMTPAVGATGTVTCTRSSLTAGATVGLDLGVTVDPATSPGTTITGTTSVGASTSDPNGSDNSASTDTTVGNSPAALSATKTVSGDFSAGGNVTYTIVLSNAGPAAQLDNPGDELTDVLPAELALLSANATSGTAVASLGTNTVTWNGSIPAAGSVTITILAQVGVALAEGTAIANQAGFVFDQDGNGANEAAGVSDDPGTAAGDDGTVFLVILGTVITPLEIPTLDLVGLLALLALLAAAAVSLLRRG